MLVLTTDVFAEWFRGLGDHEAEEVATALEVVRKLGPERAPPASSDLLLWYEHPIMADLDQAKGLALILTTYAGWRSYVERVIEQLETPRFAARLAELPAREAATVLEAIAQIKWLAGARLRWDLRVASAGLLQPRSPEHACDQVRPWYFTARGAAGFDAVDAPIRTGTLRELVLASCHPGVRLLYGVDAAKETALFVLGERLDRQFYGDSVRRAESMWKEFIEGNLRTNQPADHR